MYTMLVVDDENEIRNGFCNLFPWSEIDFTIVADFSSAQEADLYLQKNRVDVLVTDICMMGMSGLELIENESRRHPDTCLIVLSGYRDFDYAQQAMRFGVRHYLVKPIKYAQMIEVFRQIHKELDARPAQPPVQTESTVQQESPVQKEPEKEAEDSDKINPTIQKTIQKIKGFIQAHYKDVTLESTAQYIRMNPYYLSTFFHQHTGEKFIDYLTSVRMKEAARLLSHSSLRVQDIAHRVGYSTANSFSRSFRLIYGMTPREYRLHGAKKTV